MSGAVRTGVAGALPGLRCPDPRTAAGVLHEGVRRLRTARLAVPARPRRHRSGRPVSRIVMVNSVGELVAGEQYDVPDEQADRFIALGYATGELSREYTTDELATFHEGHQEVSV